jgi:hypothetical protein
MSGNSYLDVLNKWGSEVQSDRYAFPLLFLKDGTTQRVRILDDEPVVRFEHFESTGERKYTICPGRGCLFCARGDKKSPKFYSNVIDRQNGQVKVMVYSMAVVDGNEGEATNGLRVVMEFEGNPKNYDIEITNRKVRKENKDGGISEFASYAVKRVGEKSEPETAKKFDIDANLKSMLPSEQEKYVRPSGAQVREDRVRAHQEKVAETLSAALEDGEAPF